MRSWLLILLIPLGVITSSVRAETSSTKLNVNTNSAVEFFKKEFKSKWRKEDLARDVAASITGPVLFLSPCTHADDFVGMDSGISEDIANLAVDVLWIESLLTPTYPRGQWKPLLDKYVSSSIAAIQNGQQYNYNNSGPELRKLTKSLNLFRQSHNPRLPKISPAEDGCGAGETYVHLDTSPLGGHIRYINKIFARLCEEQHIEVNSKSCDHWKDFTDEVKKAAIVEHSPGMKAARMSGSYLLHVTWDHRAPVDRDLDVDTLVQPGPQDYPTYLIKSQ